MTRVSMPSVFTWAILAVQIAFSVTGNTCPALPPCSCKGLTVDCGNQNLTTFPTLKVFNVTWHSLEIYFDSNYLKTIPENAFKNLTLANGSTTTLYFQNNNLSQIETNAFKGLEESVIFLSLDHNDFTNIPFELLKLSNLETLDFRNNPLVSLDGATMMSLGKHLNIFRLGMEYFTQWPEQLNYLNNLTELDIYDLNLTKLDSNAFDGLNATLNTLSIVNSNLVQIPAAICHSHEMDFFEFYDNNNVENVRRLFEPCQVNMTAVRTVTLFGNNLRHMPNVFEIFPSMQSLFLSNNQLSSIPWDQPCKQAISPDVGPTSNRRYDVGLTYDQRRADFNVCWEVPNGSPLQYLDLENNNFTRIPAAFGKLTSLTQLKFGYNSIRSIEDSDLRGLVSLQLLALQKNPIEFIAPSAFTNNKYLNTLVLESTHLRHLPVSLIGITNLQYLLLGGDQIVCNCGMSYLRSWNVTYINIYGNCESNTKSIKQFILEELPKCP